MTSTSVVRQRERSDLIKLTIFLIIAGLFTYWVGAVMAASRPGHRAEYKAVFTDVSGLRSGDAIRIGGVDVGKVTGIAVQADSSVLVSFTVPVQDVLNASTEATIQYSNLIGDRIIQLSRPDAKAASLPVGATIPKSQTRPALDLDALLNGFKPLFEGLGTQDINNFSAALIDVLQGQGASINTLLARATSVTSALGDRQQLVGQVIRNLNTVAGTFDQRRDTVAQLIDQLSSLMAGLNGQDTQVLDAASQINHFADDASSMVSAARGALKPDLIGLAQVGSGVMRNAAALVAVLQKLPQHYAAIQDTVSYGNFFNLFLCGIRVETGSAAAPVIGPWIMSDLARCEKR